MKVDLVLAREEKLKEVHDLLERVQKGQKAVNGEGFERVRDLQPKLMVRNLFENILVRQCN